MPRCLGIADRYIVLAFLELTVNELPMENRNQEQLVKFRAKKLLEYWVGQFEALNPKEIKFVPFNL